MIHVTRAPSAQTSSSNVSGKKSRRWSASSLSGYSSSLKPLVPDWAKKLMPKPIGSSSLNLVRLCLRGERGSGWILGPCVSKVVERMAGNTTLKV